MNKLSTLMDRNLVILDLEADGVEDCLAKMISHIQRQGLLTGNAANKLMDALLERESTISTGIIEGIAIPHAYIPEVEDTRILFVKALESVDYKSLDGKPVKIFFLVFGNDSQSDKHLRLIARISRLLRDHEFLDDLQKADSPESVIAAVESVEERHF